MTRADNRYASVSVPARCRGRGRPHAHASGAARPRASRAGPLTRRTRPGRGRRLHTAVGASPRTAGRPVRRRPASPRSQSRQGRGGTGRTRPPAGRPGAAGRRARARRRRTAPARRDPPPDRRVGRRRAGDRRSSRRPGVDALGSPVGQPRGQRPDDARDPSAGARLAVRHALAHASGPMGGSLHSEAWAASRSTRSSDPVGGAGEVAAHLITGMVAPPSARFHAYASDAGPGPDAPLEWSGAARWSPKGAPRRASHGVLRRSQSTPPPARYHRRTRAGIRYPRGR